MTATHFWGRISDGHKKSETKNREQRSKKYGKGKQEKEIEDEEHRNTEMGSQEYEDIKQTIEDNEIIRPLFQKHVEETNKDRQQREEIMKLFRTNNKVKHMVRKCVEESKEMEEEGMRKSEEETE